MLVINRQGKSRKKPVWVLSESDGSPMIFQMEGMTRVITLQHKEYVDDIDTILKNQFEEATPNCVLARWTLKELETYVRESNIDAITVYAEEETGKALWLTFPKRNFVDLSGNSVKK
jgi:hypothetical protein